jgi:hypothetical protein
MPRAKWEYSASLKLPLPPLPEQCAIAHILGTLDDKIELNRRMSETLEQMARALFKAWFVDFEPVRAKMEGAGSAANRSPASLPTSTPSSPTVWCLRNWGRYRRGGGLSALVTC